MEPKIKFPFPDRLRKISGITIAYFLVGKLSILMAIPPGYSSPVWPAAGIALGGILLYGYSVWPGIFLGSFLVNAFTSMDTASAGAIIQSLTIPFLISTGASLQAMAGAFLINRFSRFPVNLERLHDIFKTIVLGGPVSCVVNATIGVVTLWAYSSIQAGDFIQNWRTWWIGDTIGVLIVIPIVSIWNIEMKHVNQRTRLWIIFPFLVAFALTIATFLIVRNDEWRHTRLIFEKQLTPVADSVVSNTNSNIDVLISIKGLFDASQKVERNEFHIFCQVHLSSHSDIQALEWIPRVKADQRVAFEEKTRKQGYSGFQIVQRQVKGKLEPALNRSEYFPVYYIEPLKGNERAFGFDLASNPKRLEALHSTIDRNLATATSRIKLVQESDGQNGILVFVPIYTKGMSLETIKKRREALQGFVVGVFRIGEMMKAAMKPFDFKGITYRLYDNTAPAGDRLLYASDLKGNYATGSRVEFENKEPVTKLGWQFHFEMAGRKWTLKFYARPEYLTNNRPWVSYAVITIGFLFTSLFGIFLLLVTGRREKTERMVNERTVELSKINTILAEEVFERKKVEEDLQAARGVLEQTVEKRTVELSKANFELEQKITEIRQSQKNIEQSETMVRRLLESAPDALLLVDIQGNILFANKEVEKIFGYSPNELIGRWHDILVPDSIRSIHTSHRSKYFKNPHTRPMGEDLELWGLKKDGQQFPIAIKLSPLILEDQTQVICIVRDITKQKQSEDAIKRRSNELKSLYEMGQGVSEFLSIDQVIQSALKGIKNSISPDTSDIFIREGNKLIPQLGHDKINGLINANQHFHKVDECLCGLAASTEKPVYSENILKDKRCTWTECKNAGIKSFASIPLKGKEGLIGVMGVGSLTKRDFGKQSEFLETLAQQVAIALENALFYRKISTYADDLEKQVNERTQELQAALKKAESADRLKSTFLASMSHELRTPLNSIIGFTGIMLQGIVGSLNEEQTKQLTMVKNSAGHLLGLINDILDLSKIEAGEVKIQLEDIDFVKIVEKVIQTIQPMSDKKQLELSYETSDRLFSIKSDAQKVEQILINLINNAIKFTEKGSVKIICEKDNDYLKTSIIDTSIGLKKNQLKAVFNTFHQTDTGLARKYEGTGLGLSICKKLTGLLGGQIWAESDGKDKGCVFSFTLPLKGR